MVGWSSRNRKRTARHQEWLNSLTPDELSRFREEEDARWKRNRPTLIILMVLAFLTLFVVWPLVAISINRVRGKEIWDVAEVVSQDKYKICKKIETCGPCAPVYYPRTEIICRPVGK